MPSFIKYLLILALLFPYFVIFSLSNDLTWPNPPFYLFYATFLQAFLSASLAMTIGFLGALGLLRFQNKSPLEIWLLLPSFFPSLFVIFGLLTLFSLFPYPFPYGLAGIVIAHSVMYSGLASVVLARAIQESCGLQPALAKLFGHFQPAICWHILLPNIKRDLFTAFLTLFCICWSSFSIPLVLGGGKWATVEIAIYEGLRFEGQFASVAILSLYQVLFLLLFISFIPTSREKKPTYDWQSIGFKGFVLPSILITFGLLWVCVMDLWDSMDVLISLVFEKHLLFKALGGTLAIGFLTGYMALLFLKGLAYVGPSWFLDRFYLLFIIPSTAVVGFSLLLFSYILKWELRSFLEPVLLSAYGLSLLFLGGIYRWKWSGEILRLSSQRQLAKLMGHSHWSIFSHIVWPQSKLLAFHLAGLVAFWSAGDFALSLMIFKDSGASLGLLLNDLLIRYEFKGASWPLLLMLLSGVLIWLCFHFIPKNIFRIQL